MAQTNPKATVIRNCCKAIASTFRRAHGEASRTLVNPSATVPIRDGLELSVRDILHAELAKTGLPVFTSEQAATEPAAAEHWLIEPLGGRRNFLHGRLPVSVHIAHVSADGQCRIGAVYFPIEDVLVLAEKGIGTVGPERLRASGRLELRDAMLLLPWPSSDVARLKLFELAETHSLHTRKTGHTLFDAIDVAAGRADLMVATRLTRLEALLCDLILAESAAIATDLHGEKLTGHSTDLVAGNLKTQPLLLAALRG